MFNTISIVFGYILPLPYVFFVFTAINVFKKIEAFFTDISLVLFLFPFKNFQNFRGFDVFILRNCSIFDILNIFFSVAKVRLQLLLLVFTFCLLTSVCCNLYKKFAL